MFVLNGVFGFTYLYEIVDISVYSSVPVINNFLKIDAILS